MKNVTVYTKAYCPYCDQAKRLLNEKAIAFTEVNLEGKAAELDALKKKTGWRTVPQIFIGEEMIGGFSELKALNASGELSKKLLPS